MPLVQLLPLTLLMQLMQLILDAAMPVMQLLLLMLLMPLMQLVLDAADAPGAAAATDAADALNCRWRLMQLMPRMCCH